MSEISANSRAPDGGWGWLVTLAAFFIFVMAYGIISAYGMLFASLFATHQTSSVITFWIFNSNQLLFSASMFLVCPLSSIFGYRIVSFVGGFFAALGIIFSSFVNHPIQLFFTLSVFFGIGAGHAVGTSFLIVPYYFNKNKGKAIGLASTGICVGQFVGPLIVALLLEHFGSKGTLLIIGALMLNICVASLFYHPVEWHSKKPSKAAPVEDQQITEEEITALQIPKDLDINKKNEKNSESRNILRSVFLTMKNDLSLIHFHRVKISGSSPALGVSTYLNFLMLVPFDLVQKGETLETISFALSTAGISHLVAKLIASSATDWIKISTRYYTIVGNFVISISLIMYLFVDSFEGLITTMVFFGIGAGVMSSMFQLNIIEFMGIEYLRNVSEVSFLSITICFLVLGPVLGQVNDSTGGFTASVVILSCIACLTGCMWFFMPYAVRIDRNKINEKNKSVDL